MQQFPVHPRVVDEFRQAVERQAAPVGLDRVGRLALQNIPGVRLLDRRQRQQQGARQLCLLGGEGVGQRLDKVRREDLAPELQGQGVERQFALLDAVEQEGEIQEQAVSLVEQDGEEVGETLASVGAGFLRRRSGLHRDRFEAGTRGLGLALKVVLQQLQVARIVRCAAMHA